MSLYKVSIYNLFFTVRLNTLLKYVVKLVIAQKAHLKL